MTISVKTIGPSTRGKYRFVIEDETGKDLAIAPQRVAFGSEAEAMAAGVRVVRGNAPDPEALRREGAEQGAEHVRTELAVAMANKDAEIADLKHRVEAGTGKLDSERRERRRAQGDLSAAKRRGRNRAALAAVLGAIAAVVVMTLANAPAL